MRWGNTLIISLASLACAICGCSGVFDHLEIHPEQPDVDFSLSYVASAAHNFSSINKELNSSEVNGSNLSNYESVTIYRDVYKNVINDPNNTYRNSVDDFKIRLNARHNNGQFEKDVVIRVGIFLKLNDSSEKIKWHIFDYDTIEGIASTSKTFQFCNFIPDGATDSGEEISPYSKALTQDLSNAEYAIFLVNTFFADRQKYDCRVSSPKMKGECQYVYDFDESEVQIQFRNFISVMTENKEVGDQITQFSVIKFEGPCINSLK